MSVKQMPQKRFRYIIEHPDGEFILDKDPKGWESHEIGFDRTDDFGLNVQNTIPLQYVGSARKKLREIYFQKSIFGVSKTRIEKRIDNWTYVPFYTYKHDYSTYKDDGKFVEISGLEDGLAYKYETYKDTEFELSLPIYDKTYLSYTGESVFRNNQIQCGYGKMREKENIFNRGFVLLGSRAVRAYNDSLSFTDTDGLPYDTMTFRCIKDVTFNLDLSLIVHISANAAFLQPTPNSGTLNVVIHNENWDIIGSPLYTYNPYKTGTAHGNNRDDWFNIVQTVPVTMTSGQLLSIVYNADNVDYDGNVLVDEGSDCYISISNLVASPYQNSLLQCFTWEWLFSELLKAIDPLSELIFDVDINNYSELISATQCVNKLGTQDSISEKIKVKLSDCLNAINVMHCAGFDITGNKFTISNRDNFYDTTETTGQIECNNIVLEHDTKHQFNKIKVGAETEDRDVDEPLYYPFICEKSYKISDTLIDKELNLMCPFIIDPTRIDRYIEKTITESDNKDETKLLLFACKKTDNSFNVNIDESGRYGQNEQSESNYFTFFSVGESVSANPAIVLNQQFTPIFTTSNSRMFLLYDFSSEDKKQIDIHVKIGFTLNSNNNFNHDHINLYMHEFFPLSVKQDTETFTGNPTERYGGIYERTISYISEPGDNGHFLLGFNLTADWSDFYIYDFSINRQDVSFELYRDHVIENFSGDSVTTYNIPFTPKRILEKHKKYLAISIYGSANKNIEYVSSKILNTGIRSKCNFETEYVEENTNLDLTSTEPMFLPITISADTISNITNIENFNNDKYKYLILTDKKNDIEYQGWINSITFAISKISSKQLVLQAKQIIT